MNKRITFILISIYVLFSSSVLFSQITYKKAVTGIRTAGYHTAEFNAGNLSSGVYFYSLISNGSKITKQMILVK